MSFRLSYADVSLPMCPCLCANYMCSFYTIARFMTVHAHRAHLHCLPLPHVSARRPTPFLTTVVLTSVKTTITTFSVFLHSPSASSSPLAGPSVVLYTLYTLQHSSLPPMFPNPCFAYHNLRFDHKSWVNLPSLPVWRRLIADTLLLSFSPCSLLFLNSYC